MNKLAATLSLFMGWLLTSQAIAASANAPLLEVTSTDLDPTSQQIRVEMVNRSDKTIVAYTLSVRQFDSAGKQINPEPFIVTFDNVFNLIYSKDGQDDTRYGFVVPGAEVNRQTLAGPRAARATVTVLAVVYKNRTADGDPKQVALVFQNRTRHAQNAASAANLLAEYPTSNVEMRSRISKIAAIHEKTGSVQNLVRTKLTNEQEWKSAAAEQKALADLLAAQAKEAQE